MGLKSCSLTPKSWKSPPMSYQHHLRPLMTINDPYMNTMLNHIIEHVSVSKNVSTEYIWVSYFQVAMAHHSVLKGARIMLMGLKSCSLTFKCWKPHPMSLQHHLRPQWPLYSLMISFDSYLQVFGTACWEWEKSWITSLNMSLVPGMCPLSISEYHTSRWQWLITRSWKEHASC